MPEHRARSYYASPALSGVLVIDGCIVDHAPAGGARCSDYPVRIDIAQPALAVGTHRRLARV